MLLWLEDIFYPLKRSFEMWDISLNNLLIVTFWIAFTHLRCSVHFQQLNTPPLYTINLHAISHIIDFPKKISLKKERKRTLFFTLLKRTVGSNFNSTISASRVINSGHSLAFILVACVLSQFKKLESKF